MSELMNRVVLGVLGVLLAPLTNWLVNHNIISSDETVKLIAEIFGYAVSIGGTALLWIRAHRRERTALAMPNGSTPAELTANVKDGITAPLSGSANQPTYLTSKGVLLFAVALAGAMAAGCGAGTPPPRIAPLPAQVDVADRNIKAVVGNLQQLLTMAAETANTVSKIEDEAAKSGVVPIAADAAFDRAMREYADASDKASNGLAAAASDGWPKLRALVQPVLDKGQAVIDAAYQLGAIKSKVSSYLSQLGSVLSAAVGEFMFGGAR